MGLSSTIEPRIDVRREVHLLAVHGALDLAVLAALVALGRREHGREPVAGRQDDVGGGRRCAAPAAAHVLHGGLHDLPDEEVQQDEDADLEDEQDDVDHATLPRRAPLRRAGAVVTRASRSGLPLEQELGGAELDAVSVLQHDLLDVAPVDDGCRSWSRGRAA